jgi:hypothetical protein
MQKGERREKKKQRQTANDLAWAFLHSSRALPLFTSAAKLRSMCIGIGMSLSLNLPYQFPLIWLGLVLILYIITAMAPLSVGLYILPSSSFSL